MLSIDKDHSPNSASLGGTSAFLTLVQCVFHEIPRVIIKLFILFFKDKLLLYLIFVSLELFMKCKIDLLEKSMVLTAEISQQK